MRENIGQPWWMHNILICGEDGQNDGQGAGSNTGSGGAATGTDNGTGGTSGGNDSGDDDGAGGDGDDGDAGDDDSDLPDDKDIDGLKSALKKEREGNRTNSKTVKQLQKQIAAQQKKLDEIADKDKTEAEKAQKAKELAEGKVSKLAEGFRKSAINAAIERVARDLKFKDVDDAISLTDRSEIEVEQDEDDPADVKVSAKSVKAAVKALADRKKHLIAGDDDGDGDPSGSQFGGRQKNKQKASEQALKDLYPSLQ